jgi:hypothetical protein
MFSPYVIRELSSDKVGNCGGGTPPYTRARRSLPPSSRAAKMLGILNIFTP